MLTLVSILFASALSGGQSTGSLAGCVVDGAHHALPGANVVTTSQSFRQATVADQSGCYELNGLAPGKYRVTGRVPGFNNVTRDDVAVAAAARTTLDLRMTISGICECIRFTGSLADHVRHADAVLHIRITGPLAGKPDGSMYYEHAATVLHAIKPGRMPQSTIGLMQNQTSGSPDPYDADQEMVVFLRSIEASRFVIVDDNPGLFLDRRTGAMVFLVRAGQVVDAPAALSKYIGSSIDSFMHELRSAAVH